MTPGPGPGHQGAVNELFRRVLFLPEQSSTMAAEIDHLHFFVIGTTMAGATAVGLLAMYWVIKYRARDGALPRSDQPAPVTPVWLELILGSGLLGLFCLWWLIGYMQFVRLRVPPANALDVYVSAKQWMWKFAYPDGQSSVTSLYVPTGRPVRLLLTSRDVIHSFFVPDFRIKQDALPGRYTSAWFQVTAPGTHQVLCAEYCGTGHSIMRGQVVALDPSDYARWLAAGNSDGVVGGLGDHPRELPQVGGVALAGPSDGEPASEEEFPAPHLVNLVRVGMEIAAQQGCLRCHTLDGTPHIGPTWAGLYRSQVPLADGRTVVADPAYLTESMMDPLAKIHATYAAVMPSYHGLLSPGQTASIIELIKYLRDVPGRTAPPAGPPAQATAPPAGAIGRPALSVEAPPPNRAPTQQPMPPAIQQGLPPPGFERSPLPVGPIEVQGPAGNRRTVPSSSATAPAAGAPNKEPSP